MSDLVCLVADKSMEAAVDGIMQRPAAIGMRPIAYEVIVHPHRDPGCFHQAEDLLMGFHSGVAHALVILDVAWDGAPTRDAPELELQLREKLTVAFGAGWAEPVAIAPELESWVFSTSPHVEDMLGWKGRKPDLRTSLLQDGLWPKTSAKPPDPKLAMERALWVVRKPWSSSIFRELAGKVSFATCQDRAFLRLKQILSDWFPAVPPA